MTRVLLPATQKDRAHTGGDLFLFQSFVYPSSFWGTEDFTEGPARASLSPPAHEDRRRPCVLVRAEAARPLHVAGGQQARLAQRRESDPGGEADLITGERQV